jgi:hypothetical protein
MAIESININNIRTDESRFSLKDVLFTSGGYSYDESLNKLGILNLVVVQKYEDGRLHLIDGRKRLLYAEKNLVEMVDAVVLSEETPVTDIITLILCGKSEEIGSSAINRAQFICFAVSLGVPEEWVLKSLCAPFGLRPHSGTLSECGRICSLPKELKRFCHDKKFSLKQLINLSSYHGDLLSLLVEWNPLLHLTASTMDELASNLRGWMRSNNKNAADLIKDEEIMEIMGSSMDPRDRTSKLRRLFRVRQFPLLSEVNSRIEMTVSGLELPEEIDIKWDRTLENRNVAVSINIHDAGKLRRVLDSLKSKEVRDALEEILNEL